MIEYVDSKGQESTRRITVFDIVSGDSGVPSLMARCHEKKKERQFRIDRIRSCVDFDGEVHDDVPQFLIDTFGMSFFNAHAKVTQKNAERWQAILDLLRSETVLLAALCRVDNLVKPVEIDVLIEYLATLVENQDIFLSPAEVASMERYAKRLRPTEDAIMRSLDAVSAKGARHVEQLLIAAKRVIEADEILHQEEVELINVMAHELAGVKVA